MVDPKIINEWLFKANDDFNFAQINLEEENEFYAQICFHFHQAAEKYLKSFIIAHNLEFEKIHDLVRLLKICATKYPSLMSLSEYCILLNTFYIETRYPVHWPTNYTKAKATEAKEAVQKIADQIKNLLQSSNLLGPKED